MSITLEEEIFGLAVNPFTKSPEMVRRYTLKNSKGMTVSVIQLGAIIQSVCLPDAYKKVDDVCLGFDDIASYLANKEPTSVGPSDEWPTGWPMASIRLTTRKSR